MKVRLAVAGVVAALVLAGCGSTSTAGSNSTAASTSTAAAPVALPNLVDMQLDAAAHAAEAAGIDWSSKDATGTRVIVNRSNWIVVRQDPAAGQPSATVTLYVDKKTDLTPTTTASRTTAPEPKIFTLTGTLTLGSATLQYGGSCSGSGGYADIAAGTAVTVYDAGGTVVAAGELGDGKFQKVTDLAPTQGRCLFPVSVESVPIKDIAFYQVEISHRGKLTVQSDAAQSGLFAATLG